ncbi:valyl-tRNA synthetase domain protein, partial [Chlamydia psittaci 06-1683]
MIPYRDT